MDGNVETEAEVDPEIVKRYQDAGAILLSGDKARAIEMLRELAAEGVAPAQYTLGNIYLHAEDRAPDADAAMRCYLEAAASGFAPAYWALGNMYLYGSGVDKSARKAADYYMEGVKLGDVDCMVFLAELLASGQLGEARHDLALPGYRTAAENGSALAQRRLGHYHLEGKEVELDLKLASELFEAAATQGDEYAAHSLALMYAHGNSAVPKDLGKAISWYELAAKKGVALAQHNLAACYANPDAPNRNLRLAAFWFHKGAEQGLRLSMESLARIYASGEGVERDPDWAEYWKARAAVTEDPNYPDRQLDQPVILSSQRSEVFPSELGCRTSNNMATVIAGLKSFGVSDNFVRGALFLFAATQMRTSDTITAKDSEMAQQWLFEHGIGYPFHRASMALPILDAFPRRCRASRCRGSDTG